MLNAPLSKAAMWKPKPMNSKQIVKVAEKLGFIFVRQSGTSHAIYFREVDRTRTTIPIHHKNL